MAALPDGLAELKQRLRASWMAGDFGQIARLNAQGAEEFVTRLNLKPGMKVLDVACGTGNQSIPAARTGAQVIGLDIAPNLLEQAGQRAQSENLKIEFIEGDAEKLPYPAGQFEVVLSMFGAMFAPRPEVVASELKRVCRPGGLIAMGNWTPEGFVGQMFQITGRHAPPPPGMLPPSLWGVEKVVAERLGSGPGKIARLDTKKQELLFDYPFWPHPNHIRAIGRARPKSPRRGPHPALGQEEPGRRQSHGNQSGVSRSPRHLSLRVPHPSFLEGWG